MSGPAGGRLLADAQRMLREAGLDEAELQAEWLLSRHLDCPRLELPLRRAQPVSEPAAHAFQIDVQRLLSGEPLSYVLGDSSFMGRSFATRPGALIPRPETEELVDWILDTEALWRIPGPYVADVGTGSGCIAVTLACERPQARLRAIDASADALALARENADRLGVGVTARIDFEERDLLAGVRPETFDAVVSNPPYVTTDAWAHLPRPIRDHEPRLALDGGPDGLAVIRRLAPQAHETLKPGGLFFLELGFDQRADVHDILGRTGFIQVQFRRDVRSQDRMVCAKKVLQNPAELESFGFVCRKQREAGGHCITRSIEHDSSSCRYENGNPGADA